MKTFDREQMFYTVDIFKVNCSFTLEKRFRLTQKESKKNQIRQFYDNSVNFDKRNRHFVKFEYFGHFNSLQFQFWM